MMGRHRELFPARREAIQRRQQGDDKGLPPTGDRDRVTRITFSGAKVTLRRIPTIDGPGSGGQTMFTDLSETAQKGLF